ncbi:MAG: murein biosynthesis integral membrane protein MurJ [Pseudomonadota bacterium]|nr:murein biosynthesis integral membrane protein MurJ [Pseudomonadota bacterium]
MFRKIIGSTTVIGKMTLLSRLLGYLRDMLIARLFGASIYTDAFFIAFKIPNLFRRFFAEGAFSTAFIPVLTEYHETRNKNNLNLFLDSQISALIVILGLVVGFGIILAPFVIIIFAPGFEQDSERYQLSVGLLRITFPYLIFISLTAFFASILNVFGRFAIAAFTPALLNICMILAAIFLSPFFSVPVYSLAVGVFIGGVLQLTLQYFSVRRLGFRVTIRSGFEHEGVKKVFKLMVPGILGGSVAQLNILIDSIIASFLTAGSISWLYYSDRVIELPLGVFGIALATAILPSLSKFAISAEFEKFDAAVKHSINWTLFLGIPSTVGIILLAEPIVVSLFQYGEMTIFDVEQCTKSLRAYALGLPAFILIKVLAAAYFARKDMLTPVKFAVVALILNTILNVVFMNYFGHVGLALATSIAAWLNAMLLFVCLKISENTINGDEKINFLRIMVASVFMSLILYWLASKLDFDAISEFWLRFLYLFLIIGAGSLTYFATSFVLGMNKQKINQLYGI